MRPAASPPTQGTFGFLFFRPYPSVSESARIGVYVSLFKRVAHPVAHPASMRLNMGRIEMYKKSYGGGKNSYGEISEISEIRM